MSGLKWGALIGIGLKFLDTLISLFFVDPVLAIMLIIVAGMCAIPRIGSGIGIVSVIVPIAISEFVKVNLLAMFLAVMIIGSILGCLPGMAIGGIVGLARKKSLPLARDAKPERYVVLKAVVLPLLGGAVLWALYLFVFNPWLMNIMRK